MKAPPGPVAIFHGANAVAACACGNEEFNLMVKIEQATGVEALVAIHCTRCHEEATVPLDRPVEQKKFITHPGQTH